MCWSSGGCTLGLGQVARLLVFEAPSLAMWYATSVATVMMSAACQIYLCELNHGPTALVETGFAMIAAATECRINPRGPFQYPAAYWCDRPNLTTPFTQE
jgi:hypothetical protein